MKRLISLFTALSITLLVLVGYINRVTLIDEYIARTHELQPAAANLLDDIKVTSRGEKLFIASRAEVLDDSSFNSACRGAHSEHSVVLGCYTKRQIYIFDVKEEKLEGVKQVTAAHELLHAYYDRLSLAERNSLWQLLRAELKQLTDKDLLQSINLYDSKNTDHYLNEVHSILGTEANKLSDKLENHYQQIFEDRSVVVAFQMNYKKAFSDIENKINQYNKTLDNLSAQHKSLEALVDSKLAEIKFRQTELNQLRNSGQTEEYNSLVPIYNQLVNEYNFSVSQLKSVVDSYNKVVMARNKLALTQNDLAKTLDSRHQQL